MKYSLYKAFVIGGKIVTGGSRVGEEVLFPNVKLSPLHGVQTTWSLFYINEHDCTFSLPEQLIYLPIKDDQSPLRNNVDATVMKSGHTVC